MKDPTAAELQLYANSLARAQRDLNKEKEDFVKKQKLEAEMLKKLDEDIQAHKRTLRVHTATLMEPHLPEISPDETSRVVITRPETWLQASCRLTTTAI